MSEPRQQAVAGCSSYKADILPKLIPEDIDHMNDMVGMDLADYATVRDNADAILRRLQEANPNRLMPPPPRGPWKPEWIECFKQWIANGKQP
jgi:hypothetical protein